MTAGDPRFHLAAQRTLLAWLRTGIAVIAFGFVIARFGLLAELLGAHEFAGGRGGGSLVLGLALVALGVVATAVGAVQYQQLCAGLAREDQPARHVVLATSAIAWAIAVAGVLLAGLLLA